MFSFLFINAVFAFFYAVSLLMLCYKYRRDRFKVIAIVIEWFFIQLATIVTVFCFCGLFYGPAEFMQQMFPF